MLINKNPYLTTNNLSKKKILFIVNQRSGDGKKETIEEAIKEYLDTDKYNYDIANTEAPHHATTLSSEAVRNNYDIVVAVGGDGSINEVAKALIGSKTSLAIIPSGSGNGLAHHLKIPFDSAKAIRVINDENIIKIDTVNLNDEKFVSIAGVGFDAYIAKKIAKETNRKFWSYIKIITQEYFNYKLTRYEIDIDGRHLVRKPLLLAFANSGQFGYNFSISPEADIQDGFVDVCILKKASFYQTFIIPVLIFLHQIDKTKYVEIIKAKKVIIKLAKNIVVHIDGEPIDVGKIINISVNPRSLNLIVPVT